MDETLEVAFEFADGRMVTIRVGNWPHFTDLVDECGPPIKVSIEGEGIAMRAEYRKHTIHTQTEIIPLEKIFG